MFLFWKVFANNTLTLEDCWILKGWCFQTFHDVYVQNFRRISASQIEAQNNLSEAHRVSQQRQRWV